jgi:sulfur dioxygenase
LQVGLRQEEIARKGWAVSAREALVLLDRRDTALVDLREASERERHGAIPGALHAPYIDLQKSLDIGGMLHDLVATSGQNILLYCAYGERSAMAVQAAQDAGLTNTRHIEGGFDAWKKAAGPVIKP